MAKGNGGAKKKAKSSKKSKKDAKVGPIVGVDVGGTKVLARLVDSETGEADGWAKASTPKTGLDDVFDTIEAVIDELLDGRASKDDLSAVGIGVPGPVDGDGLVQKCPNINGWDKPIQLSDVMGDRLGVDVVVSNDVNCGAVAEHRVGAGKGSDSLLAVFVGTGVGGGLVLDNKLVVGARGMVGEIGHMTVEPGGRPCGCGGAGHLECYAGRAGIDREARRRTQEGASPFLSDLVGSSPIKSRHIQAGVEAEDPLTLELVDDAVHALAQAIGNAASLLDIPVVVLGGGIVDRLGQTFLDDIAASPRFGGFGPDVTRLVLAERLDDAGAIGAALLAAQD